MAELGATQFADICRRGPVADQIRTIENSRRAAMRRFGLTVALGLTLTAGAAWGLTASTGIEAAAVVGLVLLIVTFVAGVHPLARASEAIKHPTLETIAVEAGMRFVPDGFDPPVFGAAYRPLFGSWISSATFTDLFHGTDQEGRNFALYEATLTRGHGKHRHTAFSGQVYAFQRRRRQQGEAVAVPDRGLFNFFKPAGGFGRVNFDSDPEFEKRFEVYATHPAEASMLFGNTAIRRTLLDLRAGGRVFAYVGPEDALVAVTAKNRFEPGTMLRSRSGEERVRLMFDDVCASLEVLKALKATIG